MIIIYNQLHPPRFSGDIAKISNFLFWVLWACLAMYTQNDIINLYKTSMFIGISKINLIIHFFLEILHFKECCNLIGWQQIWPITQEPEFCQICNWWWNINNNISFYFELSPGKTNDKIFRWIWINIYLLKWKNKH